MPGYFRHKIPLYFDEHIPGNVVLALREVKRWKKKCRILSVTNCGQSGRDDRHQFEYCRKKDYVLVTRDRGFLDDRRFPLIRCPGIIVLTQTDDEAARMLSALDQFLSFMCEMPFPKGFLGDSKFQLSVDSCIMRGRDAKTREIKAVKIRPGSSLREVAAQFNYIWNIPGKR